jgi:hypothetical protein
LLIYRPVGSSSSLASVTAAINAAAAADPNAPPIAAPAVETPSTPKNKHHQRRLAPINISPTPASISGGVGSASAVSGRARPPPPVTPTPAACNVRQEAQNTLHSKFLLLFDICN